LEFRAWFTPQFALPVAALLAVLAMTPMTRTGLAADGPVRELYKVNPGDILEVSVWKEQDLQRQLLVNPDGHLAFPLAGDMMAEGKTVEQLRQELAAKLSRFIPEVVVTVAALKVDGNLVYVLGQVARPGVFVMNRTTDVMQAISMAGGPTPFADLDEIRILRRGDQGSQIAIPFKYNDVKQGKKLDQNILLRAGDTVIVP
jgi:polysaccharide export outer membrane protein